MKNHNVNSPLFPINKDSIEYKKPVRLFSRSVDSKTKKGEKVGVLTNILYLAPSNIAFKNVNLCPYASKGCRLACLFTAGRAGVFKTIIDARLNRTRYLLANKVGFLSQVNREISNLEKLCKRKNMQAAIRFNGTSDLPVEKLINMDLYSNTKFYDYTKTLIECIYI